MKNNTTNTSLYALNDIRSQELPNRSSLNESALKKKHSTTIAGYMSNHVGVAETIDFYIQAFEFVKKRIQFASSALSQSQKHTIEKITPSTEADNSEAYQAYQLKNTFNKHIVELNKALDILINEFNQLQKDAERNAIQEFYEAIFSIRELSSLFLLLEKQEFSDRINVICDKMLNLLGAFYSRYQDELITVAGMQQQVRYGGYGQYDSIELSKPENPKEA